MEIKNFRAIHDKDYILELIGEGEHERQDFKFAISDSRKIARSIAAFANNSGGTLLVGVKDNGNIAGVRSEEDFYMIEQAAELYCKPAQKLDVTVYNVDGRFVLKADIPPSADRPVYAQDDNRQWQVYYRVADENIQAPDFLPRIWREGKRRGVLLRFSDAETRLMGYLKEGGPATIEEMSIAVHLSRSRVEATVVRLCSMGLLDAVYADGWKIALPSANRDS